MTVWEGKGEKRRGERGKEVAGGVTKWRDKGNGKERGGEGELVPPIHDLFAPRPCQYSEATEKRPLSYQTPQSVHMVRKSKL